MRERNARCISRIRTILETELVDTILIDIRIKYSRYSRRILWRDSSLGLPRARACNDHVQEPGKRRRAHVGPHDAGCLSIVLVRPFPTLRADSRATDVDGHRRPQLHRVRSRIRIKFKSARCACAIHPLRQSASTHARSPASLAWDSRNNCHSVAAAVAAARAHDSGVEREVRTIRSRPSVVSRSAVGDAHRPRREISRIRKRQKRRVIRTRSRACTRVSPHPPLIPPNHDSPASKRL